MTELFFKCPKCVSLYSTNQETLEGGQKAKAAAMTMFIGGFMVTKTPQPKCLRCRTRLERISLEEFKSLMSGKSSSQRSEP